MTIRLLGLVPYPFAMIASTAFSMSPESIWVASVAQ